MSLASLAAYASSDESDSEQEESSSLDNKQSSGVPGPSASSASSTSSAPSAQVTSSVDLIEDEDDHLMSHATVTSSLPQSQAEDREDSVTGSIFQATDVVDDVPLANKIRAEKLPKKGQKVKISIPSLSQFKDDDEEPVAKKIKPSSKGSGLFSLLPPPKAATTKEVHRALLPQSVSRPAPARRAAPAPARVPAPASQPAAPDSDEEDGGGDFFSLSEDSPALPSLPAAPAAGPLTFVEREQEAAAAAQRRLPSPEPMEEAPQPTAAGSQWPAQPAATQAEMQAEALLHLRGRRSRREATEEIQFIDVNQDDILPDRDEWMTKQLTEEKVVRRPQKSSDDPSTQSRRKHQITYLAHQAKEREVELKNEWAQNRATKDAYRTKYGF